MGFFFMSRLKSVILEENSGTVHHVVAGSFRRRYLGVALDLSVVVPWVSFFSPLKSATLSSRHFFVVSEGGSLIFWGQKSRLLCESGPKITIQVGIWSPKISKNPDFTQINKQSDTQLFGKLSILISRLRQQQCKPQSDVLALASLRYFGRKC